MTVRLFSSFQIFEKVVNLLIVLLMTVNKEYAKFA